MIIHLIKQTGIEMANQIAFENQAFLIEKEEKKLQGAPEKRIPLDNCS